MIPRIMAHMVAFYPDDVESLKIAEALAGSGANIIEIQFPFSDPTADGIYIEQACTTALKKGFTVSRGFKIVRKIRESTDIPLLIMSYANPVYIYGIERFVKEAKVSGANGLIIPDLPFDYDEGLYDLGKLNDIDIVPVITPTITSQRLEKILAMKTQHIYTTLRKGITGSHTSITPEVINFLTYLKSHDIRVLAGFGVSTKEQVEVLKELVYAVVVGTAFVRVIMDNKALLPHVAVEKKIQELIG